MTVDRITPLNPEQPFEARVVPETPEQSAAAESDAAGPAAADEISDLVSGVTARRWLEARRVLEMSTDEIMDDEVAMMIVAATAKNAAETALWQWAKFADLTPEQLADFLGVEVVADPKSDAPK